MYESTPHKLPGRNAPCWCGSGKKYKKCHLSSDRAVLGPSTRVAPRSTVRLKTPQEIEGIRAAGVLTRDILDMLEERVAAGVTTEQIDVWVQEALSSAGATAATLGYKGYPKSCCTSINEVVCHGIPEARPLIGGDIVNIDVTSILDGFYGDASRMFLVGEVSAQAKKLVDVTRECLDRAIETVRHGAFLGDIGHAIQQHAEANGFSVVRAFVGHGFAVALVQHGSTHEPGDCCAGERRITAASVFDVDEHAKSMRMDARSQPIHQVSNMTIPIRPPHNQPSLAQSGEEVPIPPP